MNMKKTQQVMEEIKCWKGYPLDIGDKVVRVHNYGNYATLVNATVVKLDPARKYGDTVGIISEGNQKIGWTYPERLINYKAFKND
jgi:hypothetical protein